MLLAAGTIRGYQYTWASVTAIALSALLGLAVSLSTFLVIGAVGEALGTLAARFPSFTFHCLQLLVLLQQPIFSHIGLQTFILSHVGCIIFAATRLLGPCRGVGLRLCLSRLRHGHAASRQASGQCGSLVSQPDDRRPFWARSSARGLLVRPGKPAQLFPSHPHAAVARRRSLGCACCAEPQGPLMTRVHACRPALLEADQIQGALFRKGTSACSAHSRCRALAALCV